MKGRTLGRLGLTMFVVDHLAVIAFIALYSAYQPTTTWALFLLLPL